MGFLDQVPWDEFDYVSLCRLQASLHCHGIKQAILSKNIGKEMLEYLTSIKDSQLLFRIIYKDLSDVQLHTVLQQLISTHNKDTNSTRDCCIIPAPSICPLEIDASHVYIDMQTTITTNMDLALRVGTLVSEKNVLCTKATRAMKLIVQTIDDIVMSIIHNTPHEILYCNCQVERHYNWCLKDVQFWVLCKRQDAFVVYETLPIDFCSHETPTIDAYHRTSTKGPRSFLYTYLLYLMRDYV
jgi:hypothetical protein